MKYQILLIEDDVQIREIITDYFSAGTEDEMEICSAKDGEEGLSRIVEGQFDLILLDIMLPKTDGFALCREVRKNSDVPIIFLTARGMEEDKLRGYLLGADDYIVKPFSLALLYAKVKALLKRTKGTVLSPIIQVGNIVLNPSEHTVKVCGKEVLLSYKEYMLLQYLMEHKNRVLSREELLIRIWGYDFEGTDRTVDNHIKKLRKKLGPEGACIKTILKRGYKIEERL